MKGNMFRGLFYFTLAVSVTLSLSLGGDAFGGGKKKTTLTGITEPEGYRDWTIIATSHRTDKGEFRFILGNDVAIKAFRESTLPFPDGSIIAKLAYEAVKSSEWDAALVPGQPKRQEFMVKDSRRFSATGGWGFARFVDGKPVGDKTLYGTCFPCHKGRVRKHDFVFTRYAP